MAIELQIQTGRPCVELLLSSEKDSLPLVRQTLKALATAVGADPNTVHDASLAISEACTNAVRHAYADGSGTIAVSIEVRDGELLTSVRDEGVGMSATDRQVAPGVAGGLGLTVIESVTREVEIRTAAGMGTEVVMKSSAPGVTTLYAEAMSGSSIELIVSRVLAMAGAQADFVPEQLTEMLLASELVARDLSERVPGDTIGLRIDQVDEGIELGVGPLRRGGAEAILRDATIPGIGPVIERLAQRVRTISHGGRSELGERLVLLFGSPTSPGRPRLG